MYDNLYYLIIIFKNNSKILKIFLEKYTIKRHMAQIVKPILDFFHKYPYNLLDGYYKSINI